jgi:GT2 family glycosyltransferase
VKLSVITAVRNAVAAGRREALVRCVRSVGALQAEHEHLVYDGASTDGTIDVLRELEAKTPGLKVVSEPDTGIYNALNKGVLDAQGKWFYVLGSDDYLVAPDSLDALLKSASDNVAMYVSPVQLDREIRSLRLHNMFDRTPYCHQGVVVRTDVMRAHGGFDERFRICADFDFLLKVHLSSADIQYLNLPFAYYSTGGTSDDVQKTLADADRVLGERFHASNSDLACLRQNGFMPASVWFRFLFHSDYALRYAARHNARQWIKTKPTLRYSLYPLVLIRRILLTVKRGEEHRR